jgi:hypothetical protein
VKNTYNSGGDLVMDEVQIDLDVLHALMLHWSCREINSTDIVTVNQGGAMNQRVKFPQELAEPCSLSNDIDDGLILSLDTGARDGRLPLRGPRNQIVPEKYNIVRS